MHEGIILTSLSYFLETNCAFLCMRVCVFEMLKNFSHDHEAIYVSKLILNRVIQSIKLHNWLNHKYLIHFGKCLLNLKIILEKKQ